MVWHCFESRAMCFCFTQADFIIKGGKTGEGFSIHHHDFSLKEITTPTLKANLTLNINVIKYTHHMCHFFMPPHYVGL